MIRANTINKKDTIHLNILITCSMLSILYMRFSMAMKVFNLHVVCMTFIMLNLFLWPDCYISHWGKTNHRHDYHGDEHHHKNHLLGPYKDFVTPIRNITETPIPQPKMTAEFGSLKKSISPIFFLNSSSFDNSESPKNRWNPKTYINSIEFGIIMIHKEKQIYGQSQRQDCRD